jgi:8-oxo-dGTP pyrophosphatase MutT (NUDIX family)
MRKIIHQGKYLTLSTENIQNHLYERATLRPGVKIIAIHQDKFLLIKEYRLHEKKSCLKLVSGWQDKDNKTSLEIAQEELQEEAGYQADNWKLFHRHQTPNNTIEEKVDYFIATNLHRLSRHSNPDNDTVEEVLFLSKEELLQKIDTKQILWDTDTAVLLIYLWQNNYLK